MHSAPFFFACSLLGSVPASKIERVVVFADRAEVTRTLSLDCGSSPREADFGLIPATADERTLRATASGKARAIGTSSRLVPVDASRDTKRAAIEAELQKVRDRLVEIDDALQIHDRKNGLVAAYGNYFTKLWSEEARNPKPDPEAWKRSLDAMKKERVEADKKAIALRAERRKTQEKATRTERLLAALHPSVALLEARHVTAPLDCAGESAVVMRLSYVLPGATWHPEYDLRFALDAKSGVKVGPGKAELVLAAVVQQSTGEDWTEAEIALSTAKPRLGTEAPYPAPLYVAAIEQDRGKVLVQTTERRDQLGGEGKNAKTSGPTSAALDDGGHVFLLKIPHAATVLSDGRPYWMPVDARTTVATSKLVTIPKIRPYVYQMVALANPAPYPLLAGRVHAYRKGSFVGDAQLRFVGPGEPIEISLGADEEIFVERKDVTEVDKGPGFLASTKSMERAYRVRVKNRAASKAAVEIRESIPVSKVEDVKVALVEGKTTPRYQLDRDRGLIVWTVDLARGEEKTIDLEYIVKLPSSWKVQ